MQELPASDANRPLVHVRASLQRQQDPHEFLSQLLHYLGNAHFDSSQASPRRPVNESSLEAVKAELTTVLRSNHADDETETAVRNAASNLLYEYLMVQWASSTTRMKS